MRRPSPSMLVALAALFVALGGAAYAVTTAPKNSVVSASIRNGEVGTADLADNGVTGAKVKDGSLDSSDVSGVKDHCPKLMTSVQFNFCIDDKYRDAGTWGQAVNKCANNGLHLPTPTELYLALRNDRLQSGLLVWTDTPSSTSTNNGQQGVDHAIMLDTSTGEMSRWTMGTTEFFYCVGPLNNIW